VITLELIRVANATFFAADRPTISDVKTAVIRLGQTAVVDILDSISARPPIGDPAVAQVFEAIRGLARQTATVCRIVGEISQPQIARLAESAGLFMLIGQMVACAYLGPAFVEDFRSRKRTALVYRLQQEHNIDVPMLQLDYLRSHGVPTFLFYAFDRGMKCKNPVQAALRFVVESAVELFDAYREDRWHKYAPNKPLPAHSALRLLQLSPEQHNQLYHRVNKYLSAQYYRTHGAEPEPDTLPSLMTDFRCLPLELSDDAAGSAKLPDAASAADDIDSSAEQIVLVQHLAVIPSDGSAHRLALEEMQLADYHPLEAPPSYIQTSPFILEIEQQTLGDSALSTLQVIEKACREAETKEALLLSVLNLLISTGTFARSALIVLNEKRNEAFLHCTAGEAMVAEVVLELKDPLSPLALCLNKIQSFNTKASGDVLSPLGVSSYAISPIRIDHASPVVLYADCGPDQPVMMEARRIFRLVIGLLNRYLPELTGGLPEKGSLTS